MIIECPYCSTRFRLNERSLGDRRPMLRCSNCKRTFALPPRPPRDADVSFEYDDDVDVEADAEADADEEELEEDDEPVVSPPAPRNEQFALPIGRDEPQPSLFATPEDHHIEDDEYSIDEPDPLAVGDDDLDDYVLDEDDDADVDTRPVPLKSLLAVIGLVVAGYALLALTLRSEPQWTRSLLQQVPLIGSEINASELGREIVLDNLDGRYEQTKEGKTIFLITGSARNEHDQAVRGIRVEFQLLGEGGVALARQSTTCGNAMRADLVRDLTEEQVRILRGWGTKPPEETTVRPGDSCPIVSIFMDVADGVTTFSGEVVQARRLS